MTGFSGRPPFARVALRPVSRNAPSTTSYSTTRPHSTASSPIRTVSRGSKDQPLGHGVFMWMYRRPRMSRALETLSKTSVGYTADVEATYGMPCASMMRGMSFGFSRFPAHVVVVRAPCGVSPDRCVPVFMYASLS